MTTENPRLGFPRPTRDPTLIQRWRNYVRQPLAKKGGPLPLLALNAVQSVAALRRGAREPMPLIVLNTLPKSGSVFLSVALFRGLACKFKKISTGTFPEDAIDPAKYLPAVARGQTVTQEHFDASAANLALLRQHNQRLVVHLRDPRQATLSWIHHLDKLVRQDLGGLLEKVSPSPPIKLFRQPLPAIIDWHLENYYPHALAWMNDWIEVAARDQSPPILITTYEQFHGQFESVVHQILDFYEIPRPCYWPASIPRHSGTHFRCGQIDEYKRVFTARQLDQADAMLAAYPRLFEIYGRRKAYAIAAENLPQWETSAAPASLAVGA